MKKYLALLLPVFFSCNNWQRDFTGLAETQGIDMREYIYTDSITITRYPSFRIIMFPSDSVRFAKQDVLIAELPEATAQLAKLYYYNMLLDSVVKPGDSSANKPNSNVRLDYKYYAALSASASAAGSLALINSNRPLILGMDVAESMPFSYGKSPMFISVVALVSASASSLTLLRSRDDGDEQIPDSTLIKSIDQAFRYYKFFFEINTNLDSVKNNTIKSALILSQHGLISIRKFISEQYFLDYLMYKGIISSLEKMKYTEFMSSFQKPLLGEFKIESSEQIGHLQYTSDSIVATATMLKNKLAVIRASPLTTGLYIHKIELAVDESLSRNYRAEIEKCDCK